MLVMSALIGWVLDLVSGIDLGSDYALCKAMGEVVHANNLWDAILSKETCLPRLHHAPQPEAR